MTELDSPVAAALHGAQVHRQQSFVDAIGMAHMDVLFEVRVPVKQYFLLQQVIAPLLDEEGGSFRDLLVLCFT